MLLVVVHGEAGVAPEDLHVRYHKEPVSVNKIISTQLLMLLTRWLS